MITIIHGDDTAKSREFYLNERNKYTEKVIVDGALLTLTDFLQISSNNGLFGDQQAIFIEDLFTKRKNLKELEAIQASIVNSQSPILLYESKELTKTQLKPFDKLGIGNILIKQFSIPKTVFAFVDALQPHTHTKTMTLFHDMLRHEDANFALAMMQRQVRLLLFLIAPNTQVAQISEVKRLAPWQKGKLEKQATTFSEAELLELHEKLYQLEHAQKTGTLAQPLDQAIDFLLLAM